MNKLNETYLSMYFLTSFKFLLEDEIISSFLTFLKGLLQDSTIEKDVANYADFISKLETQGYSDLSRYIKEVILSNQIASINEQRIEKELLIIKEFAQIKFTDIKAKFVEKYTSCADIFSNLPYLTNSEFNIDIKDLKITQDIFRSERTFIFDKNLKLKPVFARQNITFADLKGYDEQKKVLIENTSSLLNGLKVNNILLYGDSGCGKSSSVRALLSEFSEIRIVQIFKDNLINLDKLYSQLEKLPYKFIIFADDISFVETDENLSTMKAILEGSLIQCPKNAVIYATSNRRHLVRESFQSRMGDEIHLNDTMNEISSLSERFGINLLFQKPSNDEFNKIVIALASDSGIEMDDKLLIEKAQKLALTKGSRTPRIARQLIDNLLANVSV